MSLLAGFRHRRLLARMAGPRLLRAFAAAYPAARFVEIGANDGHQHDHLRPFVTSLDWTGVMVEPVPYVFERLRENYAGVAGVALERAAIAESDGTRPLYHLAEVPAPEARGLPSWYDGIGSFSRDALLSHAPEIPDLEDRMVTTEVACLTFESLCARHGLDRIDLLTVDTEGYDWGVLRTVDFAARRPRLVVYEHYHLSAADRGACADHLRDHGYELLAEGFDTFALRTGEDDALERTWRRLEPAVAAASKEADLRAGR